MNTKFDEVLWKCMDALRGNFAYEDCNRILIYIIFLKYIIDNKKIDLNNESFETFLNAQRMFDKGLLEKDIINDLNYMIENQYNMANGALSDFSNTYFKVLDFNNKVNIIEKLKVESFVNESDAVMDSLKMILLEHASSFSRIVGDEISSNSISLLTKELLGLKDHESLIDLTYGLGLSSLEITNDSNELIGYEIDRSIATMGIMLLIISEKSNFKLYNEDATNSDEYENYFDKVVAYPPLGIKVKDFDLNKSNLLKEFNLPEKNCNLEVFIALSAIKKLKETGIAIIAISSNILFSSTVVEKSFRELIVNNYLSSVITLPPLYYGTNADINLIILEKNRISDNVTFIDASNNEHYDFIVKDKKSQNELSNDAISKIVSIVNEKQTFKGISYTCSVSDLKRNDYTLSPSKYTKMKKQREVLSNEEIDSRLSELYEEIKRILK